jgi:hypothetical protein
MSKVLTARDGIASAMLALRGSGERFEGVSISTHGGDFNTEAELMAYAKHAPAIVITVQQVTPTAQTGEQPDANITFALFLLTVDKPGVKRTEGMIALVENVCEFVARYPTKNWGTCTGPVSNMIARNYYGSKFDGKGVALWGVFWTQRIELEPPSPYVYGTFDTIHVDWDLAPRDNDAALGDVVDAEDLLDFSTAPAQPVTWGGNAVTWGGNPVTW